MTVKIKDERAMMPDSFSVSRGSALMNSCNTDSVSLTGAGVVILNKDRASVLVLRCDDGYDLPKGHIDPGEMPLECAIREAREEASISDLKFLWGPRWFLCPPSLAMFVATSNSWMPAIAPNPETLEREHLVAEWVNATDAQRIVFDFLQPAIGWAIKRVREFRS